jgi:hypothetical protein
MLKRGSNFTPNGQADPSHQVTLSGNPAKDDGGTATVDGVGGRVWFKDDNGDIWVLDTETQVFEFTFDQGGSGATGTGSNAGTAGTWVNIDWD